MGETRISLIARRNKRVTWIREEKAYERRREEISSFSCLSVQNFNFLSFYVDPPRVFQAGRGGVESSTDPDKSKPYSNDVAMIDERRTRGEIDPGTKE